MRRFSMVLGIAGLIGLSADPCWACSCAPATPEEHAASADVIFAGRAVRLEVLSEAERTLLVHFEADVAYKGNVERRMAVLTAQDSAACGFPVVEGRRYTIFAFTDGGELATNLCSASQEGDIQTATFGLVGRDVEERGSVEGVPFRRQDGAVSWSFLALIALGAVLVAATLSEILRKRSQPPG